MTALDPMPTPATALDYALTYARRGWRVVPCAPGGKVPVLSAWQREGTTDEARITHWWTQAPDNSISIVTGAESRLWVLDVDGDSHGVNGADTLAALEATHGPLPDTIVHLTGGGGVHYLFAWPTDGRTVRNSASGALGEGLDVRGQGGQIVAPPSVHATGARYEIEASSPSVPAQAPEWLLELVCERPQVAPGNMPANIPAAGDRPGDMFAAAHTWDEILTADGWVLHHTDADGEQHWTRPGKERREGTSATIGYKGADVLKVFTSSIPWLRAESTYTKLGYYAARHHSGDIAAAAKALHDAGYHTPRNPADHDVAALIAPPTADDGQAVDAPEGLQPVPLGDPTWWEGDTGADWLIEPVIPAQRHTVLYAPAKMGKSLLALEVAAAAATGSPTLGRPAQDPVSVLYLDFEMTEADLRERLYDMDYGPESDWANLAYYSLPSLPPFDTPEGGIAIQSLVQRHEARLVVIDTMARVVQGEENSADTYRLFDLYVSRPLKSKGVAVLRIDHSGKDLEKGQRGSSEKVGYADLVWRLAVTEAGQATLRRTHCRVGWVPETVVMRREDDPRLVHRLTDESPSLPGLADCVRLLDDLEVPVEWSANKALKALRSAGEGRKRTVVLAAQKVRQHEAERAELSGLVRESGPVDNPDSGEVVPSGSRNHPEPPGNHPGTTQAKPPLSRAGTTREPPGTTLGGPGRGAHLSTSPPTGGTTQAPADLAGTGPPPVEELPKSKLDPFAPPPTEGA